MKHFLSNQDQISICDSKNNCIHAGGKNAEIIAFGVMTAFLLFGIAKVLEVTSK